MEEEELAQLRERRLQEHYAKAAQAQQLDSQMKSVLKQILDGQAYERAMNVKIANPELYQQMVALLAHLYRNNQLKGKVGDEQLRMLLQKVSSTRHESSISFKKKGGHDE
ncbi:MAG: DNA-binding protein [Candidatus Micrarchaeota archaeon]